MTPDQPGTDTSGDQPYPSGVLARIVAIHFPERGFAGVLYLILIVSGGNSRGHEGPGSSVEGVPEPSLDVIPGDAVKQLDEYEDPNDNTSQDGFAGCLTYIPSQTGVVGFGPWPGDCALSPPIYGSIGTDAITAYRMVAHGELAFMLALRPSINSSACAPQPTSTVVAGQDVFGEGCSLSVEYTVSVSTIPSNGFSTASKSAIYLFQIPAGEEIIEIDVNNLLDSSNNIVDHIGDAQGGGGSIQAYVYSTARQAYTEVSQLWDIYDDGEPRLDYDDGFSIGLGTDPGPAANGTYYINVYQDTTTSQIDNYGVPYQPFRVRIVPEDQGYFHQEYIPEQPPQLLGVA